LSLLSVLSLPPFYPTPSVSTTLIDAGPPNSPTLPPGLFLFPLLIPSAPVYPISDFPVLSPLLSFHHPSWRISFPKQTVEDHSFFAFSPLRFPPAFFLSSTRSAGPPQLRRIAFTTFFSSQSFLRPLIWRLGAGVGLNDAHPRESDRRFFSLYLTPPLPLSVVFSPPWDESAHSLSGTPRFFSSLSCSTTAPTPPFYPLLSPFCPLCGQAFHSAASAPQSLCHPV